MNKLIILDDVFEPDAVEAMATFPYGDGETWYDLGASPLHEKILDICRAYFDLAEVIGYEMWRNTGNPGRHIDKDEIVYKEEKRLVLPQCSAVYYPRVEKMHGGEFYTDDIRYIPKTNRLLLFSPGVAHGVSAWSGTRIAVSINPWRQRPRGR